MAIPVGFEGANKVFQAPEDMEDCWDLEAFCDENHIISCWRLSPEELERVRETGVVWLAVHGLRQPVVSVSGTALVFTDGRPSRAEPLLPKAKKGGACDG